MLDAICPRSENGQRAGGSHPAAGHLTLPRGVVVARQPLELKSMVRIHAGQPNAWACFAFYIWPAYRAGISSANTALLADVLYRLPSGPGCPSKALAAGKGVG